MNAPGRESAFAQACFAAALFAVDPLLTGLSLRAGPGPVRDAWLALLRAYLPEDAPMRRAPLAISDDRLLGGVDLAATLRAGAPVAETGLLAQTHGGVLLLAMAERLNAATAARIVAALDAGRIELARDGLSASQPTCIGVVALDEGHEPDERPPQALLDRFAFQLDLTALAPRDVARACVAPETIAAARARLADVILTHDAITTLVAVAAQFGIDSLRAPLLARRVARAACADRKSVV
jgi:magnesium chelatase subunit D